MKLPNYYIFQGGAELIKYWQEPEKWAKHQWYWSANKHVRPGEKAFIYLTAPLSRIVGEVDVLGEPFFNGEPYAFDNPHMNGKWCCEVGNPEPLNFWTEDLTIANLRKCFSIDWGWVRYPRGNTRVPKEILPMLLELAGRPVEICKRPRCHNGFIVHGDGKLSRTTVCPDCNGN